MVLELIKTFVKKLKYCIQRKSDLLRLKFKGIK